MSPLDPIQPGEMTQMFRKTHGVLVWLVEYDGDGDLAMLDVELAFTGTERECRAYIPAEGYKSKIVELT